MIKKDYKPRMFFIMLFFLLCHSMVLVRLLVMQIYNGDFYKELAQAQYQIKVHINPARGQIFDRTGFPIASNHDVISAYLLPNQLHDFMATSTLLQMHFNDAYKRLQSSTKKHHFMWVERMLSPQKYVLLHTVPDKDIRFVCEPHRFYPYPQLINLLGITDVDNGGIAGIELMFDKTLKGQSTDVLLEKDARFKLNNNCYFDQNVHQKGHIGAPVTLSIDAMLQFLVYEELKKTAESFEAQEGSVLIMNPDNGEVLVMANYPALDTYEPGKIPSLELVKNRIVTECYELGSVMKIFASMAALEEGVVKFDELINCEGKVTYINKFKVENWKSIGIEPFCEVVAKSSNIGIAKVVLRLEKKLFDYLLNLGFGKKTGIEFPGERQGFVNNPVRWSRSSPIVMSFGYEVMSSIMQLGMATSIVANGGYVIKPTLLKGNAASVKYKKLYKDTTIQEIKEILAKIGSRYPVGDYRVMGKTGTARIAELGGYSLKRHLYTFAGIIEKGVYRRVIITFLKEPSKVHLWSSESAGPLFKRVAELTVLHERLPSV